VTPVGRRQLQANRERRTEWLASRLRRLAPDDLEHLASALDALDEISARPEPVIARPVSP
jgi:hypothetical protein